MQRLQYRSSSPGLYLLLAQWLLPLLGAGITSEMMSWWLSHIEGDAPYAGDGKVWSKYLQW
jgi:hypothetical protein